MRWRELKKILTLSIQHRNICYGAVLSHNILQSLIAQSCLNEQQELPFEDHSLGILNMVVVQYVEMV